MLIPDTQDMKLIRKENKVPDDEGYNSGGSKHENLAQAGEDEEEAILEPLTIIHDDDDDDDDEEEAILEPLTIIPSPEPEPVVYIFYNSRGLSDFRFSPYTKVSCH